jgi:glycosyltransferase involved in cell wall biosynthesis
MELIDRPLLTIAIPTYNRALLLERNLTSICNSIKGFENLVEVIISDNNSNDNTAQIALSFNTLDYIHYFRNEYNIGFTYNYIKIVNQYARGRYCWIIGDDDFVREDSISYLINDLNYNYNVSFISIAFDMNWKINQLTKCNKFKF